MEDESPTLNISFRMENSKDFNEVFKSKSKSRKGFANILLTNVFFYNFRKVLNREGFYIYKQKLSDEWQQKVTEFPKYFGQ